MSDGLNLDGFATVKPAVQHNIDAHYSDNQGSAFASSDMSSQGNAGLNQEGSSSGLPITGADESDMPGTYK
jgi:hypothetical protein